MLANTTVSDLDNQKKLNFQRGTYNILDCGTRTGKTYWAVNNLVRFTRDGMKNRILFLTDTNSLKYYLLSEYEDCTEVTDFWCQQTSWGEKENKIGVMCYQSLGTRFIKENVKFLDDIDVICWDECDSIFDFAVDAFATARHTDFARKEASNAEVLAIIQKYSSKQKYMPLVLLGAWENLIHEGRIMCIGLSASPERAYAYYNSLVSASYHGRIEAGFRIESDIYFKNLFDHIRSLIPSPNHGYWCLSPTIKGNIKGVQLTNSIGFCSIELHSEANEEYPLTDEQKRVIKVIQETGMIPAPYDFVFVTKAFGRGITIKDERFDVVIVDSYRQEDRIQAARQVFPYTRHLKTFTSAIPDEYLNKWLSVEKCRELATVLSVPELDKQNSGKPMTWQKLKGFLPQIGYTVESKRKRLEGAANATQCYYITGEWHDVEVQDTGFLQLVDARLAQQEMLGD